MDFAQYKNELETLGFTTITNIFTTKEINDLITEIEKADTTADTFRKSANLFAIRRFVKEIPNIKPLIFNQKIIDIIHTLFGTDYFVVKSIYFDKPGASNWFVAYHQDLTISAKERHNINGYGPWTVKQGQFAVQPPLDVLENIYTIRIHLDDTDANNGALKVIRGSHAKGICMPETIDRNNETEVTCEVPAGGIMIMKPLLLHSSARTLNNSRRRVIHIEFSDITLPKPLQWAEIDDLKTT